MTVKSGQVADAWPDTGTGHAPLQTCLSFQNWRAENDSVLAESNASLDFGRPDSLSRVCHKALTRTSFFFKLMLSRRLFSTSAFTTRSVGAPGTVDSRVFLLKGTQTISSWHHIPLFYDSKKNSFLVNYVNEIPRGTRAKLELATKEENNPIKQDVKNGQLRYDFLRIIL
jgi:hypothetical protein